MPYLRWRGGALIATIALCAAISGCSPSQPGHAGPSPAVASPSAISAAQAAEIADGKVTQDEYDAAYRRFVSCMAKAGYPVIEKGRKGSVYDYAGLADSASAIDAGDACYNKEFQQVDIAWQLAHQEEISAQSVAFLRGCLHDHGIEPTGTTTTALVQEFTKAGLDPGICS